MVETKSIDIKKLEVNKGQIEGLPKNPRFIRDERFEALKKSILDAPEMLSLRELIVYPFNNKFVVVGGNMRLRACKDLGHKEIPCKVLDADTPVEKLREYTIKDNNGFGQDDFDLLANEWDVDELTDWGMELPDFDMDDVETEDEAKEDDFDEEKDEIETRCKAGDLWQLGEHRLMCGDSTKQDDVKKLMNGELADMVFTDPPYGYKYESNYQDKFDMLKNDDKILDFVPAIMPFIEECAIYSFCGWQSVSKWLDYFSNTSLKIKNLIVWKKNNWSMGDMKCAYAGQHELCIFLNNGKKELIGKRDTDVWEFDRVPPTLHPTMKPVELIVYALGKSSVENDIVLDCFGGSGSTLIACEQLGRKARLMELDPHYCDVIIARWEKLTGKKAEKIN